MSAVRDRLLAVSSRAYGVTFIGLAIVVGIVIFHRPEIVTWLTPGTTITAVFDRDYRLRSDVSEVRSAGIEVGTVDGVEPTPDGRSRVALKLDSGVAAKLGSAPSARIRPSTVLGGKYYVEVSAQGDPGEFTGEIPRERTSIATEADAVVETLQPRQRDGLQTFIGKYDATLRGGGNPALRDVLTSAPPALRPAAPVLDAATGDRPGRLGELVSGLDDTARVLTARRGQLGEILGSLNTTTAALDRSGRPLADTLASLPQTLRTARAGVVDLRGTLHRLTDTAPELVPAAESLDPLTDRLSPVLAEARPVVGDLRRLLIDARPLVRELVPTADKATAVFDDIRGPVINRVNGPILDALNTAWDGQGRYEGNSSPYRLYQDLAYAFTNADGAAKYTDRNGAALSIQVGGGSGTFFGLPTNPFPTMDLRGLLAAKEGSR